MGAPLTLGFDTSGPHISALLLRGTENALAEVHEDMPRGQAEALLPLLEDMLSRAGVSWSDLSAIGVGVGPGNFTGIRIAVSAARGLTLSLGIPAVGVSLLEAFALDADGPVLASVGAPRDHAYIQGFGMARDVPLAHEAIANLSEDLVEPGLGAVGSAGAGIAAHLGIPHLPAIHAPGSAIARIAATRWRDDPDAPVPLYIKPADAAPPRDAPPEIVDDLT